MKVVGLLSGGKDSCYNLCHCVGNGHQLVALASLGPEPGKEELDSYLYQTVGQDGIQLISEALELPLYRRTISGTPIELSLVYGSRTYDHSFAVDGDETEDLLMLLSQVKSFHPEIDAVSVGAILSDYQRLRVEHVCQRLQLTVLAYLWQRDQAELLKEMIEAPLDGRLIKVACIGLTSEHLGKTLQEVEPILLDLNSRYGVHVCGEGGEYETFTLDCPLFKSKISLEEVEVTQHPESSPMAFVGYLRLLRGKLISKSRGSSNLCLSDLKCPALFDDEAVKTLRSIDNFDKRKLTINKSLICNQLDDFSMDAENLPVSVSEHSGWVIFSSVMGDHRIETIEDEANDAFDRLNLLLLQNSLGLSDVAHINLSLCSMEDFAVANSVYSKRFGSSPPSRACVAVKLGGKARMMMDVICNRPRNGFGDDLRRALHVQSRSYWAPANIGPYSQAVVVGSRLFVSGQIGLIPASLTLPTPTSFIEEATLSLQHVRKIIRTFPEEKSIEGVICYLTDFSNLEGARSVWRNSESFYDGRIPCLFVEVRGLPKGAMIEWQLSFQIHKISENDGENDGSDMSVRYFGKDGCRFKGFGSDRSKDLIVIGAPDDGEKMFELPGHYATYLRVFCLPSISIEEIKKRLNSCLSSLKESSNGISVVRVRCIGLESGEPDLKVAFCMIGSLL
ncbi:meiotically up-regulated gene 71 protein [Phakopsora pachyrhizi]|uniref:Diphthine--ammonia ligase n=1 Tax=Phakopsora pachyrhizi TaxID=170000 RepID=A0AAV0BLL3_PHAPC|nr:meiotically up-regulated gene 71 protein [Phakopsora pachyrhizi]